VNQHQARTGTADGAGTDRARLTSDVVDALRRYGTDAAQLGHAFAALHGLQPADLQALVAIMSAEGSAPLTPGGLRQHLGLSSGGTSYVIDRLADAGHVRRDRDDPADHRVVHLRHTDQGMATGTAFFGPLGELVEALMGQFDDAELTVVRRFLTGAAEAVHTHLADLERRPDRPRQRARGRASPGGPTPPPSGGSGDGAA